MELVDPNTFRVCADPRNLPYSDEAGEGFENRIAKLFAAKLNEPLSYVFLPQVIGFYRNTLNALRCDVVMGVPLGDPLVQTTNPYYRTVFALVFRPDSGLDGVAHCRPAAQGQAPRRCRRDTASFDYGRKA